MYIDISCMIESFICWFYKLDHVYSDNHRSRELGTWTLERYACMLNTASLWFMSNNFISRLQTSQCPVKENNESRKLAGNPKSVCWKWHENKPTWKQAWKLPNWKWARCQNKIKTIGKTFKQKQCYITPRRGIANTKKGAEKCKAKIVC